MSLVEPVLGDAWLPVGYNWLDAVQVVALGAAAEYGQFTGATANGVLRSGSNRFAGLGEYVAAVPAWTGDNTGGLEERFREQFTPRDLLSMWDANAQVGGPLKRDRVWFFAGAGTVRQRYRPFGYDGPEHADRREPRAVVKVDAAPATGLAAQGFYQRDVGNNVGEQLSIIQTTLDTAGQRRRRNHVWNARSTFAFAHGALIEARFAGFSGSSRFGPVDPGKADGPPPRTDWFLPLVMDNVLNVFDDERRAVTGGIRLGYTGRVLGGVHDLAVGLEHERTRATVFYGFPGGRVDEFWDGVPLGTLFWEGDDIRTRNSRTTLYVQDRWSLPGRVTLEPGVRVESYAGRPRDGHAVFRTSPLAPRIGATWDVTDTHRTVARAHYGRYHDMLFSQIYSWHDRAGFTPRIYAIEETPGQFTEVQRQMDAIPAYPIAADLKQSHVDQWSAGIEHEAWRDVAVEGRYVHRRFDNFIGYQDQRLDEWVLFTGTDPGPDGRPGTGDDGGPLSGYVPYWWPDKGRDLAIANPEGAYRHYDAVQVIARKRQSDNWEGQASYTWSRTGGTIPGSEHTTATHNALSPLGFGGTPSGRARQESEKPLRSMFDYSEVKLLGWYRAPWLGGALAGAVYRWHNGARWHRTADIHEPVLNYTDLVDAEEPYSRVLPSIQLLDLRIEKTVRVAKPQGTLGVYADVMNVANTGRAKAYVARSGPRFGHPRAWTDPRTVRLGLRYTF